jgi:hypothetical protein
MEYFICGSLTAISSVLIFIYTDKKYKNNDIVIFKNCKSILLLYCLIYFTLGISLYFLIAVLKINKITFFPDYPLVLPVFIGLFSKIILKTISFEIKKIDYGVKGIPLVIDRQFSIKLNDALNHYYSSRIDRILASMKSKKIYNTMPIIENILPIQMQNNERKGYLKDLKLLKSDTLKLKYVSVYFGEKVIQLYENEINKE